MQINIMLIFMWIFAIMYLVRDFVPNQINQFINFFV